MTLARRKKRPVQDGLPPKVRPRPVQKVEPTFAPIHRDFAIREIGCVVCWMRGFRHVPCAKHHTLTTGHHGNGKRRGEQFTVGLCDYHHQGSQSVGTATAEAMYPIYGPSYYDNAREFRESYPDALLLETQEELLKQWRDGVIG